MRYGPGHDPDAAALALSRAAAARKANARRIRRGQQSSRFGSPAIVRAAFAQGDLPRLQRPLWRGALIASIWFAVVLAITLGPQLGMLQQHFNQLMTTQDPQALLQQITEAQKASGFNISAFALGVVEKILQPLVGIAFVVLYLDSKLELPSHPEAIVRPNEGDAVR